MKTFFPATVIVFLVVQLFPFVTHALCVNVSSANLRSGPGKAYDVAWKVYRYMPLQKVGVSVSGDWFAVKDVDGDVEWVHKSLVSDGGRCGVVKSETANLRTGPGVSYPRKFQEPALKYDSFRIIAAKNNWLKVEDENKNLAWVNRDLLWLSGM